MLPTSRSARLVVAALAVALVVAACDDTGTSRGVRRALGPSGGLAWRPCGPGLECARLEVPLDHDDPGGETVELALARAPAGDPDDRIGALLVNPGGPGAPGTELAAAAASFLPEELTDRFDVVGWDPRGVETSTAVDCLDDLDPVFALDYSPDDPGERAALDEMARDVAAACEERSGELLAHVSSVDTVRDMDRIREALGEEALTYLGYSYGTYLGALYAELFPDRVRALVLDGAVDPAMTPVQANLEQAAGFEAALQGFFDWCERNRCPFAEGEDRAEAFGRLVARVDGEPIPVGRRTLGPGELDLGVATLLYSGVPGWQELGSSLADAVEGDGEALLDASDWYVGRDPDGSYDNSQEAFWAIGCLDGGLAPDEIDAVAEQAATASPFFGPSTVYLGIVCTTWPYPAVEVPTVRGAGAPPIVVIGTTGDPATPLRWARALADQLESARLVVFEGEGHTAFPSFDGCLDGAVVDYLVDLVPPADGTTCP